MNILTKPICLIIFGPQASGKGTQTAKLASDFNLQVISTGNILKSSRERNDELGLKVKEYYDQGKLVPDTLVVDLIKDKLDKINIDNGIIFEGFPRTVEQIKLFQNLISDYKFKKVLAIYLDVKRESVLKRVSTRLVCANCSKPFIPTDKAYKEGICDSCNGKLITRSDDTKEALEKRLEIYYSQTVPVIEFFKDQKGLLEINGELTIEEVYKEITDKLNNLGIIKK